MQKILEKLYKPEMDSDLEWADLGAKEVRECVKLGQDYIVIHGNDVMILTPYQLQNEIIGKTDSGRQYELFAYKWNPTKKRTEL